MKKGDLKKLFSIPVIVAALGYFVDIYDLLLFSIVRIPSLRGLGVPMLSYLIRVSFCFGANGWPGGIIWGIMGDKRVILCLFGSILLYH